MGHRPIKKTKHDHAYLLLILTRYITRRFKKHCVNAPLILFDLLYFGHANVCKHQVKLNTLKRLDYLESTP